MDIKKNWDEFVGRLKETPVAGSNLADVLVKTLIFFTLLLATVLLFSGGRSSQTLEWKVGDIATKKVVAPFKFFVLKTPEELKAETTAKVNTVPFFFVYNDSVTKRQLRNIDQVLPFLLKEKRAFGSHLKKAAGRDSLMIKISNELLKRFNIRFSVANLNVLFDLLKNPANVRQIEKTLDLAKKYLKHGIINLRQDEITRPNVIVVRKGIEESLPQESRVDLPTTLKAIENSLLQHFDVNQTVVLNYLFSQLIQPNLIYNKEFTDKKVEEVIAAISHTKDMVYENERIVDANERIDKNIYQKLYSLQQARIERSRREGRWPERISFLARLMLIGAILFVGGLYLATFRKDIFADNKKWLLIALVFFLEFLIAAVITRTLNWHAFLIPTSIASMLLAILIDSGIGLWGTVIIALILGGIQGGGYDLVVLTLISGLVGLYSVYSIRNRNQIFKAIVYIAVAYFWVYIGLTALRYESLTEALRLFSFYLLPNSILSPLLTFMVLGLFERMFDITTDVSLLELSDLNHPLLKRLSLEAPGTFHHSMVVGNLAEAAAKAINANPLLARVGSYFHDVGKIEKPEYFVENQMDAENRHNQLSPNMSALILASHVKSGIELAKKYGIPRRIRDFIPEHHGTNIMKYFYNKAVQASAENEVNETDFRYPGPKPQSKETAIVMLADAVEAATRTLQNPTPSKLRAFVENLVDERFKEGELDECDITMRDIKMIIDAFLPVLYGVFQHRIEYPDAEKKNTPKSKTRSEKAAKNENPDSSVKSRSEAKGKTT